MKPGQLLLPVVLLILSVACSKKAPPHYIFCDGRDQAGWLLISTSHDDDGYLISCTYQSPDKKQAYTVSCGRDGCG